MSRILRVASRSPIGHWMTSSHNSFGLPLLNQRIATPLGDDPQSIDGCVANSIINRPENPQRDAAKRRRNEILAGPRRLPAGIKCSAWRHHPDERQLIVHAPKAYAASLRSYKTIGRLRF